MAKDAYICSTSWTQLSILCMVLQLFSNFCSHLTLSKADHDFCPKRLPQKYMWCRTRGRSKTSWLRATCTSRTWMTARPMTNCDSFLRSASCLCCLAASFLLHAGLLGCKGCMHALLNCSQGAESHWAISAVHAHPGYIIIDMPHQASGADTLPTLLLGPCHEESTGITSLSHLALASQLRHAISVSRCHCLNKRPSCSKQ